MEVPDIPPIPGVTVDYTGPEIIFCHFDAKTQTEVRWAQKQGRRLVEPGENQETGLIGGGTEAQVYKQRRLGPSSSGDDALPRYRVVKELRLLSGRNASEEIDNRRKQSINIFAFFAKVRSPHSLSRRADSSMCRSALNLAPSISSSLTAGLSTMARPTSLWSMFNMET